MQYLENLPDVIAVQYAIPVATLKHLPNGKTLQGSCILCQSGHISNVLCAVQAMQTTIAQTVPRAWNEQIAARDMSCCAAKPLHVSMLMYACQVPDQKIQGYCEPTIVLHSREASSVTVRDS